MGALTGKDYASAFDFVARLHGVHDDLPQWLVREVTKLVGADHVTWNDVALTVPWSQVVQWPDLPDLERRTEVFSHHMLEHPCLRHWMRTGDLGPVKLSDFVSRRELHGLGLYGALYREIGYEDQFNMFLQAPAPTGQAMGLARSRRSFTERDRAMLALLRPQVAQAQANLQALQRAQRALDQHEHLHASLGVCMIELDAACRIERCPSHGRAWLRTYFGEPMRGDRLPDVLLAWLRTSKDGGASLVRRHADRRLTVRTFSGIDGSARLLLEERTSWSGVEHLRERGLTTRELEVLLEVEHGRTNEEIAAALFISPATVKKHLQNAFARLGVSTRTAAVAMLREPRSGP